MDQQPPTTARFLRLSHRAPRHRTAAGVLRADREWKVLDDVRRPALPLALLQTGASDVDRRTVRSLENPRPPALALPSTPRRLRRPRPATDDDARRFASCLLAFPLSPNATPRALRVTRRAKPQHRRMAAAFRQVSKTTARAQQAPARPYSRVYWHAHCRSPFVRLAVPDRGAGRAALRDRGGARGGENRWATRRPRLADALAAPATAPARKIRLRLRPKGTEKLLAACARAARLLNHRLQCANA